MDNKKQLTELHKEHSEWNKELRFAQDEIKTYNSRLSEIVLANTKSNVLAHVEHFQNQFIRHNEVIDELLHEVNIEEEKIVTQSKASNTDTEVKVAEENEKLVEKMQSFTKLFEELKVEFQQFLVQTL